MVVRNGRWIQTPRAARLAILAARKSNPGGNGQKEILVMWLILFGSVVARKLLLSVI